MKEKWGYISPADIDRTHRISYSLKQSCKVTPVIVKFVSCNDWRKIYISKKILKGKVPITESLTVLRIAKLKEAKKKGLSDFIEQLSADY